MTTSTIQFYATRPELVALAQRWHRELGCWTTVMVFFPDFNAETYGPSVDLAGRAESLERARRICYTLDAPTGKASSPYDFLQANPDSLVFDLGESSAAGIRESALAMKAGDPRVLAKWKPVFKALRSETSAGVFMVSRDTGASHLYKNFRYTAGAGAASRDGVKLLSLAPSVYGRVGEEGGVAQ